MTTTIALVTATKNNLRYLVSIDATGGAATISAAGTATPDFVTDSATVLGSPINRIANAGLLGIGSIAAGALTQAQARSLFLGDDTALAGVNVPKAKTTTLFRGDPKAATIGVDMLSGTGGMTVTCGGAGSAVTAAAYVDVQLRHSIWL